jgi:hypothetical protein
MDKTWLGMSVIVWIALAIGALNEIVNRAKWTKAQSIFQGIGAFLLWVPVLGPILSKFPVIGAILSRIAARDPEEGKLAIPPAATPPAAVLFPFLMLMGGCPGLQAWGKCQLGALPQTSQGAMACASAALNGQGDWQSAVTACIGSLAPSQFNCIVAAIAAGSGGDKLSPDGMKSPIKERAELWLNAHGGVPKACAEPTRL